MRNVSEGAAARFHTDIPSAIGSKTCREATSPLSVRFFGPPSKRRGQDTVWLAWARAENLRTRFLMLAYCSRMSSNGVELSGRLIRIPNKRAVMKAHLKTLSTRTWLFLVVPVVALAYPVIRIVGPAVIHAVVPEVVRSVLRVI